MALEDLLEDNVWRFGFVLSDSVLDSLIEFFFLCSSGFGLGLVFVWLGFWLCFGVLFVFLFVLRYKKSIPNTKQMERAT